MSQTIKLKRGLDLNLAGSLADDAPLRKVEPSRIAIVPDDFPGFIPKVLVKEGEAVSAGQPLAKDKVNGEVCIVSPVDGTVEAVVRGERRKVLRIVVKVAEKQSAPESKSRESLSADELTAALQRSGLWALMRQRPYDIVPVAGRRPVNIFVTAFDSAPLAPNLEAEVAGRDKEIQAGIKALAQLTDGKVYVSTRPDSAIQVPAPAEHVIIEGPHTAGNAGVQANNIAPVNKGQVIWTLDIVTVARIGAFILTGCPFWTTKVAVTGSEVETPTLIDTIVGADIRQLVEGNLKTSDRHQRIISGNILTGWKTDMDGFLRFPWRQITVIPEGDDVDEFMGWASLSPKKMSESRSFLSKLTGRKGFAPDARLLGGRRAMIMSGQYDKVMPMDIMPEYLIKAILSRDIDRMEQLGIYEVAPEDFALAEYVDPSKLELQKIVREGLDYLRKELD